MVDLFFANLVPLLGLIVALIGIAIFRLSRRDRAMAAMVVVIGIAFIVLGLTAEEGAPPADPSPSPVVTASPE